MDEARRLYEFVDNYIAIDVINSIFLENYEFKNNVLFYRDFLSKYELFEKLLNDTVSEELFQKKVMTLRAALNKSIRECIIYQFITYCSRIIDLRYLEAKNLNLDNAALENQNSDYCREKEKLVCELEYNILEIQNKDEVNPVEFIKEATYLLRTMEERVFNQFRRHQ